ncbi:Protein LSD1 [Forsythia ovata]|uniref:Protein LSD1 n=1 Tax=Forsythia ovata TaxID=205694 RepID=A0ABD1RZY9_9LAMI
MGFMFCINTVPMPPYHASVSMKEGHEKSAQNPANYKFIIFQGICRAKWCAVGVGLSSSIREDATNVCCALCNAVTAVPPPGMEMAQLICGGCRTLLMHARGATSVRCSCCHTVNLVPAPNHIAHVNCGNCHTMLMYPAGAPSVKCAICHFITTVNMGESRFPIPVQGPDGNSTSASTPSTSTAASHPQNQTVVVQNPMSVDESGKLVSNVVVGITT